MARLWYVSREGKVTGPYPEAALTQDLLLGRLEPETRISLDQENWVPASSYAELKGTAGAAEARAVAEDWAGQRREAARRWADQRSGEERRDNADAPAVPGRRTGEERRSSGTERHPMESRQLASAGSDRLAWRIGLALAVLLIVLLVLAYFFGPVNPIRVRIG